MRVMPMRAKVFAMVIELRTNEVCGGNFESVNSFRFTPEYFNVDLLKLDMKILSEPFDVFECEFSPFPPHLPSFSTLASFPVDFEHQYRRE